MIKITVTKADAKVIKGTSAKGKPYELHIQAAYASVIDPDTGEQAEIPEKFEIILPRDQTEPYPRGVYTLAPSSIYVDRDGRMAVTPRLVPVNSKADAK